MNAAEERKKRLERAENALTAVMTSLYPADGARMTAELLRRFGSPGAVIEAGKYQLMQAGLSETNALLISMIPDLVRHMERIKYGEHPLLSTLTAAQDYLSMRFIGCNIERFYLLALDGSGRLLQCIHMQSGNEDSAPFYLKHVLSHTVLTGAKALIITHNHPNVTPWPSTADIDCTAALMEAVTTIDAPLLDHVIMVGHVAVSVRGLGYIPEIRWRKQSPDNPLLLRWLEGWDEESATELLFSGADAART